MIEQPITLKIKEIVDEAKDIKTFFFSHDLNAKPGQFVMVWIPRIDQKPMGVSYQKDGSFGITVQKIGRFTEKLFELKVGDYVGIQGPYGKPFQIKGKSVVLVGGGFGSAPLNFLYDELMKEKIDVSFIIGARKKDYLMFKDKKEVIHCTDDGTFGKKGFTTDALKELVDDGHAIDTVYTCGPEKMMKGIIDICDKNRISCQVSLERYMKCGFGVCGQCAVDPAGICICQEGPVFDKEVVLNISEFGKYSRDGTGKKNDL